MESAQAFVTVATVLVVLVQSEPVCSTDSYSDVIRVTGKTEGCEGKGNVSHCVRNLDDVFGLTIKNSTAIQFMTTSTPLSTVLLFDGLMHIAIIGEPGSRTTVECEQQNQTHKGGAGIRFSLVQDITVRNITFRGCGLLHDTTSGNNTTVSTRSALYLADCIDVSFTGVHFKQSNGKGLTLRDTVGTVNISNCTFDSNAVAKLEEGQYPGGGGMFVEFTGYPLGKQHFSNSLYIISHSQFTSNTAQLLDKSEASTTRAQGTRFPGMGRGGGMGVLLKGQARNNTIRVEGCVFDGNSAISGGAFYVVLRDSTKNNTVNVSSTKFLGNSAMGTDASGGGALSIGLTFLGLTFLGVDPPRHNRFFFYDCQFTNNSAIRAFGGAVSIFSSQTTKGWEDLGNTLVFDNCSWTENKAQFGAAIDIAPDIWSTLGRGYLPVLTFVDCKFLSNCVTCNFDKIDQAEVEQYFPGVGVFVVTNFPVEFEGESLFASNSGTALYVTSSYVIFKANSKVTFERNTGMRGGAIALNGNSLMLVDDDSRFSFVNNTSKRPGAAIYFHCINLQYSFSSKSCFIQYLGDTNKDVVSRNITFVFEGNHHTYNHGRGDSIKATSIKPCFRACSDDGVLDPRMPEEAFKCIATFQFANEGSEHVQVSTVGGAFQKKQNFTPPLKVIPGKEFPLPFHILDDFGEKANEKYHVSLENSGGPEVKLGNSEVYMSYDQLALYGRSGQSARLTAVKSGYQEVAISLPVTLAVCPPGFVEDGGEGREQCICSALVPKKRYLGVTECNMTNYSAHVANGFWIGVLDSTSKQELVSSYCPLLICSQNESGYRILPITHSSDKLNQALCEKTRTGRVCGKCSTNHSVYFHSYYLRCFRNSALCRAGPVFYILSELLPLTILFLVVMVLNISFTSGAVNGFILFAQVFGPLTIDAQGLLRVNNQVLRHLINVSCFIYRFLNLEFFTADVLSFCLWKGATALDILAMKYVTVFYTLCLVVVTVLVMKYCSCCHRCYRQTAPSVAQSYVIHGLSTFLILCYTQVASVSFAILTPISLYGQGYAYRARVSAYQGTTEYFSPDHLPYALPAIVFLATIVILPPLLLLVYPLHYRVLAFVHLEESEFFNKLSCRFSIARLKPLLDSFQSCFKDDFRFFAGLYLFYRISIYGVRVFVSEMTFRYTFIELELLVMISLHSLCQPYQRRWHNVLDTLLFFDMAVINGLTLYNQSQVVAGLSRDNLLTVLNAIQVVLVNLPLVCVGLYVGSKVVRTLRGYCKRKVPPRTNDEVAEMSDSVSLTETCDVPYHELMTESECAFANFVSSSDSDSQAIGVVTDVY